jgi:hypothetical protein
MPARSKIALLPEDIRSELERRLITSGFSNYDAIATWLRDQDVDISRSAVARFGQDFAAKCDAIRIATEQARAIVTTVGDDEGNMNEALIRLIQQLSFDVLIKNQDADVASLLPKMGVMIAKLSKASVDQKKWQRDVKTKAQQAVDNIEQKTAGRKRQLDPETLRIIKEEIYGIVPRPNNSAGG